MISDFITALSPKLLADTAREPVAPGAALLRLETTSARDGMFDGAWWPRSRDLASQLPGLISALTARLGPVTRVGLDEGAWDDIPGRLIIEGKAVRIDSFPVGDDTMIVTRGDQDHFLLLMIPPGAAEPAARSAMARALMAGGTASAEEILVLAGVIPAVQRSEPRPERP
jgi:hypothetical protein